MRDDTSTPTTKDADWPTGRGEMARRLRQLDWRATALGPVDRWPQRLKGAVETMLATPIIATLAVGKEHLFLYNDHAAPLYGDAHPEALGKPLHDVFPEGWGVVAPLHERAFAGESVAVKSVTLGTRSVGERTDRFDAYLVPVRDDGGEVIAVAMTGFEVSAREEAEQALRESAEDQRVLLTELQHRVRNTLAVVRSIAQRTADNTTTAEDMLAHFQGRLDAFSRVQSVLTRSPDAKVDLESLIEDELIAHAAKGGEQVRIMGPRIDLPPRTAERLSLAIHELATNAVKHGALCSDRGRVRIRWKKRANGSGSELVLDWKESGVDLEVAEIRREGFGMELLRRSLPYDLQAETRIELAPTGLQFELKMPLAERA